MFDPENPDDISRLRTSIAWTERKLRPFREEKMDCLRLAAGYHYGENTAVDKQPIPMIDMAVNIHQRHLASGIPQLQVRAKDKSMQATALDIELATNKVVRDIELGDTLNQAVIQSLFSLGIIKVGLASDGSLASEGGYLHGSGKVFADVVLDEDFFWEMTAKRPEQCGYMGNRFRVPVEWVKENKQFKKKVRESVTVTTPGEYDGDRGGYGIRSETISQGQTALFDEYEDRVELLEIWLPEEKLIITMADTSAKDILRVVDWHGPTHGPFHWLGFKWLPGNLMPLPPVAQWRDLHELCNHMANKAARQAERQKTWTAVMGAGKDDMQRVVDVNDGEAIYVENPDAIKMVVNPGADKETLGMAIWAKDLLSYIAGNLDTLGGLAVGSRTVGQDRLLNENASGLIQDMQQRMLMFTKRICTDIAWYTWNDPLANIPIQKPIEGTPYHLSTRFTPDSKQGEFHDYDFEVDPYSLQVASPSERANSLTQFMETIVIPMMPMMQQSGAALDFQKFFAMNAKYRQLDELNDLIIFTQGADQAEAGGGGAGTGQPGEPPQEPPSKMQRPRQSPTTTRNYVRHNPGAAAQNGNAQLVQSLFSGQGNPQHALPAG